MNIHPAFLFLALAALVAGGFFLCIGSFMIMVKLAAAAVERFRFRQLRSRVAKDPRRGHDDGEGNLVFKQGHFSVKYRVIDGDGPYPVVKFVSQKRRLWGYEEKAGGLSRSFRDFWTYRDWTYFFTPRVFLLVVALVLVLYLAVFEPFRFKVDRLRWVVSSVVGLPIKSVSVTPGGWLVISGQRRAAADNQTEGWSYYLSPLKWLVSSDSGFIVRDRSDNGAVAYPVKYDNHGNISIKKEGTWVKGTVKGNTVQWDAVRGSGTRSNAIFGQSDRRLKDTIVIKDK